MEKLPEINIIFEDNHLMVVEKPINIPVQEDDSNDLDLITILKEYRKKNEQKKGDAFIGLVHRLDRPVSGIMVFAKTSKAASRLAEQLRNRTFDKNYFAVVENNISISGTLTDYLVKDKNNNISSVTDEKRGKLSVLEYRVVSKKDNLSLVSINLLTGRSHQIRVQFSSRGNPLFGDQKYNINSIPNTNIALFANKISFYHPITKEKLTFELALPNGYPFNLFK